MISSVEPTAEQINAAALNGVSIEYIGNINPFTVYIGEIYDAGDFEGVIVDHPSAALALCYEFLIGVFEKKTLDPKDFDSDGEQENFFADGFHIYDRRD